MFKTILYSKRYWISTILLGLLFIVLFSAIAHIMEYGGIAPDLFFKEKIADGKWIRYVASRLVGGSIYGMVMAYYFELRKRKAK